MISVIFIFLVSINSLSSGPYPTVAEKWFQYGRITPPKDNNLQEFRDIEIDLYAPLEKDSNGNEFYWIQINGDTITLTNFNWFDIEGNLSFILEKDPCGISRNVLIGLETGSAYISNSKKINKFNFRVQLESNSSVFINIISEPGPICKIDSDNRNFALKLVNPTFTVDDDNE